MASQAPPPHLRETVSAMYDHQGLCHDLLQNINALDTLGILPSRIHNNGTGLFAKHAIPEGSEIFRSTPLVACVADGQQAITCDYCFASKATNFNGVDNMRPKYDVVMILEISLCMQCGACGYCSMDCYMKAWEKYHQFECNALSQFPTAGYWIRMLWRVLAMHKQGAFSEQEWRALRHLWGHRGQNPFGINSHTIVTIAMDAKTLMQSELGDETIQDLYCKILSSGMPMKLPGEENYGRMLDLVGSLINHSCDPNAVVFFERGQLRLQSLKPIHAGDEITQTYADLKAGVLMRRRELWARSFFFCNCARCVAEHLVISVLSININRGFSINHFAETEIKIVNLRNHVFTNNIYTADQVEATLDGLTRAIFPTRPWPDTLKPIGIMKFLLARLYISSNNHRQAAMHALQGCLSSTQRSGPEWVDSLHVFLLYLEQFIVALGAAQVDILGLRNFRYFFNGLLNELVAQVNKVYGIDTRYTTAIVTWYSNVINTMEPPLPGEQGFAYIFGSAQEGILRWAGVEKEMGFVLSIAGG